MYKVYILYSHRSGRHYVGQTHDLDQRLAEHNSGQDLELTGSCPGPWVLIHVEHFEFRIEATQREEWLKSEIGSVWIVENLPITT